MSIQLPQPDQYSDWRDWARAITAQVSVVLATPEVTIVDSTPPPPPTELENITIRDELDRIILNPEGLWIWDPFGQLPIAPGVFAIDTQHLVDAAITTAKLQDLSVNVSKLAALSVDASKLVDSSVTTTKIANLAVGTAAIAIGAVGTAQIANAAILSALIGDLAVTTSKIDNLAVNEAKIANASISSAKIQDLQVTNAKIANGAIDAVKIGAAVINRTHIQDGEIVNAKIGDTIQSSGWNATTKQGWRINKLGQIEGSALTLYDSFGAIVFSAAGPSPIGAANRLRGGDFMSPLWGPYDNSAVHTAFTLTADDRGRQQMNITFPAGTDTAKGTFYAGPQSLEPDAYFVVSFEAKASTFGTTQMSLHWNVGPVEQVALSNPVLTANWQRYVFRIKTGASVDPNLYLGTIPNSAMFGTLSIREVQVERGLYPTDWKENTQDASERALWSKVTGAGKPADNADVTAANIAAGIAGQGALATQNSVNLASQAAGLLANSQVAGLGALALQNTVSLETQALGLLANSQVSGLGALALINQLTGGNINTFIQAAAIGTALIADGAILNAKIGNGEISSAKIADAAITAAKIQALAVGTAAIADLAVTGAKIANASITTAKIGDAQITSAKIASLDASKITSGEINTDLLRIDGVTLDTDGSGNLIIKGGGVASAQLAQNALIVPYTYSQSGFGVLPNGFWNTLTLNGNIVSMDVNNDSNGSSFAVFIFSVLVTQNGGGSDAVNFRMRHGSTVLSQAYDSIDVSGSTTRPNVICLIFFDTIPANTTRTYLLEANSDDTTGLRAAHGLGLLFKKS